MTMKRSKKEIITNFVYHNPRSPLSVITEISGMGNNSSCSNLLSKLIGEGKVIRQREGKISLFSAAPGYSPTIIPDAPPPKCSYDEIKDLEEKIAQLEQRGLFRRAQTLLTELVAMQNTATGVALIAQRRNACVRKLRARP